MSKLVNFIIYIDKLYFKEDTMNNLCAILVLNSIIEDVIETKYNLNYELCKTSKTIVN